MPMTTRRTRRLATGALVAVVTAITAVGVQAQLRFDRGQNVVPVFEGWEENPDGTFTMVFGYLNRNYEEMPEAADGVGGSARAAAAAVLQADDAADDASGAAGAAAAEPGGGGGGGCCGK